MIRRGCIAFVTALALAGCGGAADSTDVTPDPAGSGAVAAALPRVPALRFDGEPTRIGFEPIPLVGGDFPALMSFDFLPDSDEFLAVNRSGTVGHFRLEHDRAVLLGSFQIPAAYVEGDCAASAIAIDPNFSSNRLFYVGYCIDVQYNVVKRYTMSDKDFAETLFTSANVLATGDPKAQVAERAIGSIAFGPDGILWVNTGDRHRDANAQDLTNELGKVVRLSPFKRQNVSGYEIPGGNAFPQRPPLSPLIYAYGFRNPWRGTFDAKGRYWVADVGSTQYEEINVVTEAGQNFGWSNSEGPLCRRGTCEQFVRPVRFWDMSDDHAFIREDPLIKETPPPFRTAWVGIEYVPPAEDPYKGLLTGKMLYGDFYLGYVRGITLDDEGRIADDRHLGHVELPVAWRQGRDGYLYVGTMYASFDRADAPAGADDTASEQQGQLWRAVPLP